MVGLCLSVVEHKMHWQRSVLFECCTATVQQCVGFNAKISVEKCFWYCLQLYLRSDHKSFLLVTAIVVLLRSICLLLGYSAMIVTLLSVVVVLRVHRLRVITIFVPVAPV